MLDALAALELPATFFVIGQQVPERAAVLRRMVEAGHAVGVHAWEHPDLGAEPERAPDEIDRCLAAVRDAAGIAPDLFRPPFGSYTPAVLEQADARGLRTILWDVNPHDHAGGDATAESITADVLGAVRRGSIVVLHGVASRPSEQPTVIIGIRFSGRHEAGTTRDAGRRRPGRMRIRPTSRPKS